MHDLTGQNMVVAGGSSGIGLSVVEKLIARGAQVTVLSRSAHASFSQLGVNHISWDATQGEVSKEWMPDTIHGLVYAPGTIVLKPFQSLKMEVFRNDWEVNVGGVIQLLQAAFRPLKNAKGASVVLYSTVAVASGMNFHASIAAAKGAVEGLGKSLAAEWAKYPIRVNIVAPSLTNTPLASQLLSTPEKVEASAKRHPLARVGQPEEVADATIWLLGAESGWITGHILPVDGGMSNLRPL